VFFKILKLVILKTHLKVISYQIKRRYTYLSTIFLLFFYGLNLKYRNIEFKGSVKMNHIIMNNYETFQLNFKTNLVFDNTVVFMAI